MEESGSQNESENENMQNTECYTIHESRHNMHTYILIKNEDSTMNLVEDCYQFDKAL